MTGIAVLSLYRACWGGVKWAGTKSGGGGLAPYFIMLCAPLSPTGFWTNFLESDLGRCEWAEI